MSDQSNIIESRDCVTPLLYYVSCNKEEVAKTILSNHAENKRRTIVVTSESVSFARHKTTLQHSRGYSMYTLAALLSYETVAIETFKLLSLSFKNKPILPLRMPMLSFTPFS